MLSDEVIDKVIERVVNRIEQANEFVLEKIGKNIKAISKLSSSEAQQLIQILRYGGDFDKIVQRLSEITELNVKDIYEIFEEVAKKDYQFAKTFYDYKGINFIPYEENYALKRQVEALARITAEDYLKITRNSVVGFTVKDIDNNIVFKDLSTAYNDILEKAVLSVSQGKTTFQDEMYSTIKQMGASGLKYVDYASGRTRRLDSAVKMSLKGALRELHNELQSQFGEEFGANMVEISVHSRPADDHLMQGHQFMIEEFNKLQNGEEAKDLKGRIYTLDYDGNGSYRPISEYNCYHYIFYGIAGVSSPVYSDEELQEIIDENNKGFELDGKHYSMYEGEQLLRKVELELRKSKDMQIMAKSASNKDLILESQTRITQLTNKYRDILKVSNLPSKLDRARVSGYHRVNVDKMK